VIQRVEAGRELSHGALSDLEATLPESVAHGVLAIHMDASRVLAFDSQSLESLVEFHELAMSRGLEFVLVDPSELLGVALRITGLDQRLEIRRDEQPVEAGEEA
jgi:anti-anti-sigma regulatory factor